MTDQQYEAIDSKRLEEIDALLRDKQLDDLEKNVAARALALLPRLTARMRVIEAQLEAAREDSARLEFVFSALNEWGKFSDFCEEYHPTLSTSRERADDIGWRAAIDVARGAK